MLRAFLADNRPPSPVLRFLAAVSALIFFRAGIAEILAPGGWDKSFGIPLQRSEGLAYVQAVGARNATLALMAIIGALIGNRGLMFLCFIAIALIAALDAYVVKSAGLTTMYMKHCVFSVLLALAALWTAFSGKSKRQDSSR